MDNPDVIYVEYFDDGQEPMIYRNAREIEDAAAEAGGELTVHQYQLLGKVKARTEHKIVLEPAED